MKKEVALGRGKEREDGIRAKKQRKEKKKERKERSRKERKRKTHPPLKIDLHHHL